jgi:hypothetical protein
MELLKCLEEGSTDSTGRVPLNQGTGTFVLIASILLGRFYFDALATLHPVHGPRLQGVH